MTLTILLALIAVLALTALVLWLDYKLVCKRSDIDHPVGKERVGLDVDFNWPDRDIGPESRTQPEDQRAA